MMTTKADKLLKSLIDAGLSLTEFTILATKILRIQHELKSDDHDRRSRDRFRKQEKQREENLYEQQIQQEEQRRKEGRKKLQELGYLSADDMATSMSQQDIKNIPTYGTNKANEVKGDNLLVPYTKEMDLMRQKQRDCCLTFNIDFDLRRNQQTLERACRRAKRNIYELRAERFHRPEHRSVLSVETITLHHKLKEAIREINRMFDESKSDEDKRFLQELVTYINQFEGDIDLLMCQMQYEPKVKETILFSPVATDILDRMNLILHHVRTVAQKISAGEHLTENLPDEDDPANPTNLPDKVNYIIKIKTNEEASSSLSEDANVTIKLHGTHNKSTDIRLVQSTNKVKWQSGQIDIFNIELNYLGDLYAAELWHDSEYSSWKVDWIEIIDDAANIYRFPVDRLFDKHSEEKKSRFIIQRDVGPVHRLPTKPVQQTKSYKQIGFATYTVKVKTGKQPNKVTDSAVYIQMKGENGEFSDQLTSANSAFKSSIFEPDQLDTFYLVWPHLAKLESLSLLVKSEGNQPAWFCEYVMVEDSQSEEKYKFVVNQLLDGSNPDDQNLKRHVTVYPENTNQPSKKEGTDQPGYLMKIKTGEKGLSNSSIAPSINVTFKGEKDKTETYTLKPTDPKRKLFQENQTDEFIIPSKHYVGPIKDLQISSNGPTNNWFIENIVMRDIARGKDYVFPTYKFLNQQDGTNKLTVQPLNERKPDYKVYTRTIASEMKGPDRSIKLLLQGTKGKQEVELRNPVSMKNTFQPGQKDEFYIENLKSLGELQSIQVDVAHPNIKKLGLDYIEIKDVATNSSYKFDINRMLDEKHPKMTSKAELVPPSSFNPSSSRTSPSQFPSPNPSTSKTNKTNFDQLTPNLPQGSKRPNQGSNISIKFEKQNADRSVNDTSEEKSITEGDRSVKENNYQVKIKTMNKEFLDKDTKLQIELIDTNGKSISNQTEQNLTKGQIDSLSIDAPKDFGKLKNIKLSLVGSISKKKNLYQPDFIEIIDPNGHQIDRLEYSKDDVLNSENNRFEITKPIKRNLSNDSREKARPQGATPSAIISTKPTVSPYTKLAEKLLNEYDEDSQSLHDQTINSSITENLSKEIPSSVDKLPNRQIRPGDRVKNNLKKQMGNQRSEASLHEADWYRRSIETNKDHRGDAKQMQISEKQHVSQTKFDHRQANLIKNQYEEKQKLKRRFSKENQINLLPKTSSSRSLQGNETGKERPNLPLNHEELPNHTVNTKARVEMDKLKENSMKAKRDKFLNAQTLPVSRKADPDYSTLKNNAVSNKADYRSRRQVQQQTGSDEQIDTRMARDIPSAFEQLPSGNDKSFDRFSDETNPNNPRSKLGTKNSSVIHQQRIGPSSISTPPESHTRNDIPQRRSQSAISSRYTSKSSVNSTHTENLSNQLSKTSIAKKISADLSPASSRQRNYPDEQLAISESSSSEDNVLPNIQSRSAVTIHTTTTKSDSDLHPIKRMMASQESEHSSSSSSKSLLSPGKTKPSGDNHRQNVTKTADVPTVQKFNKSIPPSSQKYLGKETSEVQNAPRPASGRSRVDEASLPRELKTSSIYNKIEQKNEDSISEESDSYPDQRLAPKISDIQSIASSINQQQTKLKEPSSNISNTADAFDTKHSGLSKKLSTYSNVSNKRFDMDHMSTVDEESEVSSNRDFSRIQPSAPKSEIDSRSKDIQKWSETKSKRSSPDIVYTEQNRTVSNSKHSVLSTKPSTYSNLSNKRFDMDRTRSVSEESEPFIKNGSNRVVSSVPASGSRREDVQKWSETKPKGSTLDRRYLEQNRVVSNSVSNSKHSVLSTKSSAHSNESNDRFNIGHKDTDYQKPQLPSRSTSNRIKPSESKPDRHLKDSQTSIDQHQILPNVASEAKPPVSSKKQSTDSHISNKRFETNRMDTFHQRSEPPSRGASNHVQSSQPTSDSHLKTIPNRTETRSSTDRSKGVSNISSDTTHSLSSKKPSSYSNVPNKRVDTDHMSTVSEESEPSSKSLSNSIASSVYRQKDVENWAERKSTEPSLDMSDMAVNTKDFKSSTKPSTYSGISNKHMRTIKDASNRLASSVHPQKDIENWTERKSKEPQMDMSDVAVDTKDSISSKKLSTSSSIANKRFDTNHMSTIHEVSEPYSLGPSNRVKSSVPTTDSQPKTIPNRFETKSKVSSTHSDVLPYQKLKASSKEKSLSSLLPRSSQGSSHHKRTINAKSVVTPIKSNTSIDYEFRVQTGNESQLDGTTESISIELINTKGQSLKVPLLHSLNNPRPFQKGQLDVFHLDIPTNFHQIRKIKLSLSETTNDPLHIRYCELQERQTMNTFYFPIEKWLGEKNTYHVEMFINNSLI